MKRLLSLVAYAVVLAGCGASTQRADLRVVATVSPADLVSGQVMTVTVTVENDGDRTEQIDDNDCLAFTFTVRDLTGVVVQPSGQFCNLPGLPAHVLAPGDSYSSRLTWRGQVGDLGLPASTYVVPGSYRLSGIVYAVAGTFESAPVDIRIVPAPAAR